MPFVFDPLEEEKRKQEQTQQAGAAPAMTGGGETFGAGSSQFQGGAKSEKGTLGQGSGFVGLDKYMSANKGSGFGEQFTGKVEGSLDTAKDTLNTGAEAFKNASNQGATHWNDVQGDVKSIVDSAGDNTTQDQVGKIQGLASAKYQGPERFLGSAHGTKAQGSVQKATQQANAMQSEGGRFALLDQFYGRPKYSMGEKTLDNFLVQSTPGVAAKSQLMGGKAKQLSSEGAKTTQELDNFAAANRQATLDAAKQTNDYLGGAVTGFKDDLSQRYADYGSGLDAYNQARQSDISDDVWDADTMGLFGLNEGDSLYNVDVANYLQENPKASMGQFASDDDYARYLALSQLAGDDPTFLSEGDRGQAGTGADMGRYSVNREALTRDIGDAGKRYETAVSDIRDSVEDTLIRDHSNSNFTPGGTGANALQALHSMDPAQMQAAYDAFGEYNGGELATLLKETMDALNLANETYKPTRKLRTGGA